MPNFPITDSHVHLLNPHEIQYSWLDDAPNFKRPWLLDDFNQATDQVQIEKIVFMEVCCDDHEVHREVEWVTGLAQKDPRIQGIIAGVKFENRDTVEGVLETHAKNPLVKSVRRVTQELDIDFAIRPEFIDGVRLLPKYNLLCDLCIHHPQVSNITKLVDACPDVRFVLDHIGKPDIRNQKFEPWKSDIQALSERENVTCKISGMVTEADWEQWVPGDFRPYLDVVFEAFGEDRLMYGSDWPVCRLGGEYGRIYRLVEEYVSQFSAEAQAKFFGGVASAFYGLKG